MCMVCFVDGSPGFMMMMLGSLTFWITRGLVDLGWSGVAVGVLRMNKSFTRNSTE